MSYTFEKYIPDAIRTESTLSPLNEDVVKRGLTNRLYHAIVGIQTELNEIGEAFDNASVKGEGVDNVNLLEECGDVCWYLAIAFDELKITETRVPVPSVASNYSEPLARINKQCAELLDQTKKVMFYGKTFDIEKAESLIYKMLVSVSYLIISFNGIKEQVLLTNINKLKARYPEKFTEQDAEVRNLTAERAILDEGLSK